MSEIRDSNNFEHYCCIQTSTAFGRLDLYTFAEIFQNSKQGKMLNKNTNKTEFRKSRIGHPTHFHCLENPPPNPQPVFGWDGVGW